MKQNSISAQNRGFLIVKWTFSVFLFLVVLGFIGNRAYLSAILILVIAILLLPVLSSKLKNKLPFLNRGVKIGLGITLLVLAGLCLPKEYRDKVRKESRDRHVADSIAKEDKECAKLEEIQSVKDSGNHKSTIGRKQSNWALITVPQYSIEKEIQIRYDGAKSYFVLMKKVDLSSSRFVDSIKLIVNDIVALKGGKINIEIFDSEKALDLMYQSDYGTNTLGRLLTKKERRFLERHNIAGFSGELTSMPYLNTLMIFPSAFKTSREVGGYCQSIEYNLK